MLFPNADVVVNPALLVLLGVIVGTLGGFFGVGGGFLITGGLLVFGVPPIFAVGTGLTLIMGSSIINMLKHRDSGNVDARLALLTMVGATPALFMAERINAILDAAGVAALVIGYIYVVLLGLLGIFIVYDSLKSRSGTSSGSGDITTAGVAIWLQSLRLPPASIRIPGFRTVSMYISLPKSGINSIHVLLPLAAGFAVGLMAGLLGAGGGFILLPVFIYVMGVPTIVAVGTGLLQITVTGTIGTILYPLSNHVDLLMVVIMLCAASVGSQLGATATRFVDAGRIRILFGVTVLSGAVAVALKQVADSVPSLEFLTTVAAFVLLGVSGAMCIVIAVFLLRATRGRQNTGM